VLLDEEAAAALDQMSGTSSSAKGKQKYKRAETTSWVERGGSFTPGREWEAEGYGDTGGASRFFYVAKASRRERNAGLDGMPERAAGAMDGNSGRSGGRLGGDGSPVRIPTAQNHHPTVKPIALMRYLLTLVTPPGGIVLDPFAGSGTTLVACAELGLSAIGVELKEEYAEIAARRIDHALNIRAGRLPLNMVAD
jgi:hypothetical protein